MQTARSKKWTRGSGFESIWAICWRGTSLACSGQLGSIDSGRLQFWNHFNTHCKLGTCNILYCKHIYICIIYIETHIIKGSWEAIFRDTDDFYPSDFTSHNNTSHNNTSHNNTSTKGGVRLYITQQYITQKKGTKGGVVWDFSSQNSTSDNNISQKRNARRVAWDLAFVLGRKPEHETVSFSV